MVAARDYALALSVREISTARNGCTVRHAHYSRVASAQRATRSARRPLRKTPPTTKSRATNYRVLQFPAVVTGEDCVCLRTMSMAISIDCS